MPKLIMVPTPIGNLGDITLRALDALRQADLVYCEDTRVTGKLLKHFEISKPLRSFHQHNEHHTVTCVLDEIRQCEVVVYCSDAGTPGISDPGYLLARACVEQGVELECLPGATALIPALVMSGLPCERFIFEGFLPHKKGRQTRILAWKEEPRTVVLYESTHRIHKTMSQMAELLNPERRACIAREISKLYQEILHGTLHELAELTEKRELKGELVVILEGAHEA
jgi:16S rRNA (cytidine1402-2'-O)-methyltransferase